MSNKEQNYREFKEEMRVIADLGHTQSVLSWDQETYMPDKGISFRSQQLGTLSTIAQEKYVADDIKLCAQSVSESYGEGDDEKINADLYLKERARQEKLSPAFVGRSTEVTSAARHAWQQAKHDDDFRAFAPHLEKVVVLLRERARLIDEARDPYEVLLSEFDEGASIEQIDMIFADLKKELLPLYQKTQEAPTINDDFLYEGVYDKQKQLDVIHKVTSLIGYDFDRGRVDLVEHPFCTTFSPDDVRITTRLKEDDLTFGLWSSIHEAGHALYEQGMRSDQYGMPLGAAAGMSIHESQSRLWENIVGHSLDFVERILPDLQKSFPEQLGGLSGMDVFKAINKVKPWPIRIESDELTYHLHILIRYEIERDLIGGMLAIEDVPEVWNAKYKDYLGIDIKSDREGVLQDVHWSLGCMGYFPTYSLGSLYGAQFMEYAYKSVSGLEDDLKCGRYDTLLKWLQENIHEHGQRYVSNDLCRHVTGNELSVAPFVTYLTSKLKNIYNI